MNNTIEAVENIIVPDGFTPVIGFRRFGIPWPPSRKNEYCLVQRGHRWEPREPTVAECRRPGVGPCVEVAPTQDCGLREEMALPSRRSLKQMTTTL